VFWLNVVVPQCRHAAAMAAELPTPESCQRTIRPLVRRQVSVPRRVAQRYRSKRPSLSLVRL